MIKKSKKFWASMASTFLVVAIGFSYPKILRWQVEKRIPSGVKFESASVNFSGVILSGVEFDKGWVSGKLNSVSSDFGAKNIKVSGGTVNLNLDKRPPNDRSNSQGRNVQFSSISVTASYQNYTANVKDVYTEGSKICFSEANLEKPFVFAGSGCLDRESNLVIFKNVDAKKIDIDDLSIEGGIINKVSYNIKNQTAAVDDVSARIKFKNHEFLITTSDVTITKLPFSVMIKTFRVKHPWISSGWITVENANISKQKTWNITAANSSIKFDPEDLMISGSENCSEWISSLPHGIKVHPLDTIKFSGSTSFSVGFNPKPSFTLKSDCKASCNSLPNLRKKFTYSAYTPTGERIQRETGPGSKNWMSLGYMGDMPFAVMMMEDPGFERHRGFITQAFFNSFVDNIKHNKFLRGGSTITMQLVKNVWLNREKTLSRKIQEFFLSQAVESCYSKEEIMELYLNVIEFGPNRYGAASGSQYWFKKGPAELTPIESFWLASILPRPSRTGPPTEHSLSKIKSLMKQFAASDRIPEDMFQFIDEGNISDEEKIVDP